MNILNIYGSIIYASTCATLVETIVKARKDGANLRWANLRWANLEGADLRGADLRGADLRWADLRRARLEGANLEGADLEGADLRGADLRGANLRWANLRGANLRGANLRGANLEGANLEGADLEGAVKLPIFCKWSHGITDETINIGCETRSIEDWDLFFKSTEVIKTERDTTEFRQIEAVYLAYKAYLTHLNN
jgi:uncharacterized protein YjbI with pentapeptide repeats